MADIHGLMEKLVLAEIQGKKQAIHAYDSIVWKIRGGFLTLLFGGWSILLTGISEAREGVPLDYKPLALGLFLFSVGLAFGALYLDLGYIRGKFRVIAALNRLVDEVRTSAGDYQKLSPELLKVAGDNPAMPYDVAGYREAVRANVILYLAPLAVLGIVIMLVVR